MAIQTVNAGATGAAIRAILNANFAELDSLKATLASPTFTGTPAAPTAALGTNTTQLASTAFVQAAIANLVATAPSTLDTLNELASALGNDANFAATMTAALAGKQATLVSGSNIKTVNGTSLLGSGDITISGGSSATGAANTLQITNGSGALAAATGVLWAGSGLGLQMPTIRLAGNVSAAAWTTDGIGIQHAARTLTDTSSTGTVAAAYTNVLGGNTIAASSATTFTNYASLFLGSPSAGTNVTISNPWSLWAAGPVRTGALTVAGGTVTTAGQSLLSLTGTFNGAGQTLTGLLVNATDTASAAGSLFVDMQQSGVSRYRVRKDGRVFANTWSNTAETQVASWEALWGGATGLAVYSTGGFGVLGGPLSLGNQVYLFADAANVLAQYNGTAAQAFNIYNTRVDGSNYERGFLRWSGNVLQIGAEAAGTGTVRGMRLIVPASTAALQIFKADGSLAFNFDTTNNRLLGFGGTTASFPAISYTGAELQFCLADGSDFTNIRAYDVKARNLLPSGYVALSEQTQPAAGAADTARIYAADDGAGNTVVRTRVNGGGIRSLGVMGPMTLAQLNAMTTTDLVAGVTRAWVSDGAAPGEFVWNGTAWVAQVANQVLDVVSQSATGTALSGACLYGGIRIRSGSPTLTVYDNTSATGTAIHTITTGSATGGPLSNGWYPWASLGGMRANTTGVHVVLSGSGTWDVIVSPA